MQLCSPHGRGSCGGSSRGGKASGERQRSADHGQLYLRRQNSVELINVKTKEPEVD